jgi:hypothetical protein
MGCIELSDVAQSLADTRFALGLRPALLTADRRSVNVPFK